MKLSQITLLNFNGKELDYKHWQKIDQLCAQMLRIDDSELLNATDKSSVEILLVKLGTKIDQTTMNYFPNLKYIGMFGTGYGGIDTSYASKKNITVTNIADYATAGVAEFTFAILLEQMRNISEARARARAGNYSDDFLGTEIKGKKIGVIGLGNIGRHIAKIARAYGAEVSYWSRNRKPTAEANGIKYCKLKDLLATSDVVTLNLEFNPETQGIIDEKLISIIKPGAIFINPSPMELISFDALNQRLSRNDITFIFDHTDELTNKQIKILEAHSNCIMYPPIAYLTHEASQQKKQIYVDNLLNFLKGTPTNLVSKV